MTLASLCIAALFGIVITVNHQMSLRAVVRFSPLHGRVFWWLNVALPSAVMLMIVPDYAVIGLVVASVLCFALHKRRQYLQAKASRLCLRA